MELRRFYTRCNLYVIRDYVEERRDVDFKPAFASLKHLSGYALRDKLYQTAAV